MYQPARTRASPLQNGQYHVLIGIRVMPQIHSGMLRNKKTTIHEPGPSELSQTREKIGPKPLRTIACSKMWVKRLQPIPALRLSHQSAPLLAKIGILKPIWICELWQC